MKKKLKNKSLIYFKHFENKNILELSKLFSKNIILEDWDIKIQGKKKLLDFLQKVFKENEFKIKIIDFFINDLKRIVACQILLTTKKKEKLEIIDIIYFDKKYNITKIHAYRC